MRVYEQINALPPAGIGKKSANIIAAGSAGCPQLARRQGGTVMNNEGRKAHLVGSGIANLDGEGMPSCGERGDKILARAGMRQLRR